jgi:two-component system response regulator HydG
VDDEKIVRESLSVWLEKFGYEAIPVEGGEQALKLLDQQDWNILLVDLKMPRVDGLKVLSRALDTKPGIPVIIFTAYATVDTAVEAMKTGAYDYLVKPIDPDLLILKVEKIIEKQRLAQENLRLREKINSDCKFDEIVGKSAPLREVLEMISLVSESDSTVLITGESGTGKELVARAIHRNSERCYKPFIAVSIGALPEPLVESELFGYERGAFTGATHARIGKLELANGGTLFLDEIGDMSPKMQVDLLRVLEERACYRLGGTRQINIDVRVISATNRNLQQAIREGSFREDLYYRLNVVEIRLPPLRERGGDILILAEHFLAAFCRKMNKKKEGFAPEVLERFSSYVWPGNVRELENAIERAVVVGKGPRVTLEDLPFHSEKSAPPVAVSIKDVERRHIQQTLENTAWNVTKAAQLLEIDRATLYKKIKVYNLTRPEDLS